MTVSSEIVLPGDGSMGQSLPQELEIPSIVMRHAEKSRTVSGNSRGRLPSSLCVTESAQQCRVSLAPRFLQSFELS